MAKHAGDATKKTMVLRWLRTHGERYTPQQVSCIWNIPVSTANEWFWIADVTTRHEGTNWADGLSMRLASVSLGKTANVIRQIRRERKAADRLAGVHL